MDNKKSISITLLGTGTSTGVPVVACNCDVCHSMDEKDKRLRSSALVSFISPKDGLEKNILIDTTPDLRAQALANKIERIDAVLFTHPHADHIFGIDDLRTFNFVQKTEIPLYCSKKMKVELERTFSYIFTPQTEHLGAPPPNLKIKTFEAYEEINLWGVSFLPLPFMHGNVEVFGFKFAQSAYLTDIKEIPKENFNHLSNLKTLIISCLRQKEHRTHLNHSEVKELLNRLTPEQAFFTHISHDHTHKEIEEIFFSYTNATPGYDGQQIKTLV